MNHFSELDKQFMYQALDLAAQGRYSTSPNPRVGCVLVQGAQVVGVGFHVKAGEPHAEVHAMRQAGEAVRGATAYVTLEPCAHFGRTPPCSQGLLKAGVARVVVAMRDPHPLVAGKGLAMLEAGGVAVACGLLEAQARELNRGFLSRIERNRPFISLKMAASLDGKTALSDGRSQWITGEAARYKVQELRAQSCAVLTGIGTVLADNPKLNVREIKTLRQPIRVVLDSRFRLPENAHLVQDGGETWVFTLRADAPGWVSRYPNIKIFRQPEMNNGLNLNDICQILAENGVGEMLIEAGETLATAFLQADLVDEMVYFQSPKILGGAARGLFSLPENGEILSREADWQTSALTPVGMDICWVLRRR